VELERLIHCIMDKRGSLKVNWVVTYGSAKGYITFEMFQIEGRLDVDEVHSTSDGCMIYTYFHLKTRMRECHIMKCMENMKKSHGIILSEVFGYDAVDSHSRNKSLMEHIAMRMLLGHMQSGNPSFISCTDGLPGVKRGLLMHYDGISKIRIVLTKRARTLVPALDEISEKLQTTTGKLEEEITRSDLLLEERAILLMRIESLQRKNHSLASNMELLKKGREMIKSLFEPASLP
jgi:hypothetical protein